MLEMIVSMGVFSIAVLIAVGSLLALTNAQKKALVLQSTQDNLRFALETMARDIRTGDLYHCADDVVLTRVDCASGNDIFTFLNASGATVTYKASGNRILRSINGGVTFDPTTSSDITIEYLLFFVIGSPEDDGTPGGDKFHPRVTIVAKGVSGSGASRSELNLQTTVSQRKIQR